MTVLRASSVTLSKSSRHLRAAIPARVSSSSPWGRRTAHRHLARRATTTGPRLGSGERNWSTGATLSTFSWDSWTAANGPACWPSSGSKMPRKASRSRIEGPVRPGPRWNLQPRTATGSRPSRSSPRPGWSPLRSRTPLTMGCTREPLLVVDLGRGGPGGAGRRRFLGGSPRESDHRPRRPADGLHRVPRRRPGHDAQCPSRIPTARHYQIAGKT